ncbi:hypothetical protein CXB51_005585 [Gossypium anomalum]|uniref:DUF7963 domain-containing protein n=1 Tax=Gossypium anomalum TaxID=47600 RepID=A0A8J5ZCG0_9ROSI|nr:hypothetical protein CXB51_005585 [Gossypium anomalum]
MVQIKAIEGKGDWYWAHLEPMLVHNTDIGLPKAVKLRCSLCDTIFSISNPLKNNFRTFIPLVVSLLLRVLVLFQLAYSPSPRAVVTASSGTRNFLLEQYLVLSDGREDLGVLAMFEDRVKKLKSLKASPGPTLSKSQIECVVGFLADWMYKCCGLVSFSNLEHPKFRAFLNQVGLPPVPTRELVRSRLDVKYEEVKAESEAKIRDAMLFQIALMDGNGEESVVNLTVNLPNGTSLHRKAIFFTGSIPSKYGEEVLLETLTVICGNVVQQCAGIVVGKFKTKALRNLQSQRHWMVNLSYQFQGFNSLIKDFTKDLPLLKTVTENALKVASFINNTSQIQSSFQKYQLQECGIPRLLRVPLSDHGFGPVCTMKNAGVGSDENGGGCRGREEGIRRKKMDTK